MINHVFLESPQRLERTRPKVSVVVAMYNEEMNIHELVKRVRDVFEKMGVTWEMIMVDDGSTDGTYQTLKEVWYRDRVEFRVRRIKVIKLSRNFGKENALSAGLKFATGDVIIPMDADLQDPPEVIPLLYAKWQEGFDVVNAVRSHREGEEWVKKATSYAFYRLFNSIAGTKIPNDTGDFRLLSRKALNALNELNETRRFMKGLFSFIGFKTANVPYDREPRRRGKSKWNYASLLSLAVEGITSFSILPLRFSTFAGAAVSAFSLGYGLYLLIRTLVIGNGVPGYPSLIISVLFLGGVQLLALGIIGEYVGRIFEESKGRPVFIIDEARGVRGGNV